MPKIVKPKAIPLNTLSTTSSDVICMVGGYIRISALSIDADTTGILLNLESNLEGATFSEFDDVDGVTITANGEIDFTSGLSSGATRLVNARVIGTYNDATYRIDKAFSIVGNEAAPEIRLSSLAVGAPTLNDLMAPGEVVASICGKTAGSTITLTGAAFTSGKLTVAGSNIVVGAAGPLTAGDVTGTFSLVEEFAEATNSPLTSGPFGSITVAASVETAPVNTAAPIITGTPQEGQTLAVSDGTWSGAPTFAYQWLRDATPIAGATSASYALVSADVGATITCAVTATNAGGSTGSTAAGVGPVLIAAPVNTVAPAITGTAQEGQTLSVSDGNWSGAPTFTYQWLRDGTPIAGATSDTYALVTVDVSTTITCTVTATNAGGSTAATTAGVGPVLVAAPVNSVVPAITGTAQEGQTLSVSDGDWSDAPTFTYQWLRDGTPIVGATSATYALVSADVGAIITCIVTATNAGGNTGSTAAGVGPVLIAAPVNTGAPTITGTAQEGQTLAVADGTWSGAPTFTFQWLRDGTPIVGATSATYALVSADVGSSIACIVTATNAGGSADAAAAGVGPILAGVPVNTVAPAITGTAQEGQTLAVSDGDWSGAPTFTYQWLVDGTPIAGATSATYALVSADVGSIITCTVTATNAGGIATATAAGVGPVLIAAPVNTVTPAITGTAQEGQTLSVSEGDWSGAPTFTYQWQRDGTPIVGATSDTYALVTDDVGATITCTVTAANAGGSTGATATGVGPVLVAVPVNTVAPAITGTAQEGQTLSVSDGDWSGSPTFSYQWRRDGTPIAGATSAAYGLATADIGTTITCTVTATNTSGSTDATAAGVGPIVAAPEDGPVNTVAPAITGTAQEGETLAVSDGTWSGTPTFAYQWRRDGTPIAGATTATYGLVTADIGTTITCTVTATNASGSTDATAPGVGPILAAVPVNSVAPAITGTTQEGQTLAVSDGDWSGAPTFTYQWQRDGTPIVGATSATYALVSADVGSIITCTVTATNASGSTDATAAGVGPVLIAAPVNSVAPAITGMAQEGQTLAVSDGTWSGAPTFTYQWLRDGAPIAGATSATYALVSADVGAIITCIVTATNAGGSADATAAGVGPILAAVPVNTAAPTITGMAQEGQTLSVSDGTWSGAPTFSYQWMRDGTPIVGATSATYALVSADVGAIITCIVTATNAGGSADATAAGVGPILAAVPVNTVAPAITGTAQEGQTLSVSDGTWSGAPTFAYQWMRDGTPIVGATSATYALVTADVGATITCTVTATNAGGSTDATAAGVGPVLIAAPINSVAPSITGTAQEGQTLSVSDGTWSGSPSFTYQWLRDGAPIATATSATYVLVPADVGTAISCSVTATNAGGSATATAAGVGPVLVAAPVNSVAPAITGMAQEGQTLSVSDGDWSGAPTFDYQWLRDGTPIAGATSATYALVSADVGAIITCIVTATNAGGSTAATTAGVGPVLVAAPVNSVAPAITGMAQEGQTLSVSDGDWSGAPTFTYQWLRDGAPIAGATSATYALVSADVGSTIACIVTATNAGGSTDATAAGVGPILAAVPVNTVAPAITGTAQEGQTLAVSDGDWSGAPTFTYQWLGDGTPIAGATSATYALVSADVGAIITCTVTATNAGGSTDATAAGVGPVLIAAPVNTAAPTITGMAQEGQTLAVADGTWSGAPALTYQWLRDGAPIAGATSATYALVSADVGSTIACIVTATNAGGSTDATAAGVGPVLIAAPVNSVAPAISGTAQEGQTLAVSDGDWSGAPTFTYHWLRDGAPIIGASGDTYALVTDDVGTTITCTVTATNAGGSTDATATGVGPVLIAAPVNTVPPVLTGIAQEGRMIAVSIGSWTGSPTFTAQWLRNGTPIAGATSATYVLVTADVGFTISCKIVATNAGGSTTVTSVSVGPVLIAAPINSVTPSITGTAQEGQTLAVSDGDWSGAPTFTYQWLRDGAPIAGATNVTYALVTADVGTTITCTVTATNAGGSADATAAGVGPVLIAAPINSLAPSITGTAQEGQTLSVSDGTWSGSPSFTYQWLRDGAPIATATSATYVLVPADVGTAISCSVTATNAGGSATATAAGVGPVLIAAPVNSVAPAITGTAQEGQTLSVSNGTWSGAPTFTYQWRRDGTAISGATSATYTLVTADVGASITCTVTATNAGGSGAATSAGVGPIIAAGPTLAALTVGTATLNSLMVPGEVVAAISGRTADSTITMTGTAFTSGKLAVSGTNIVVGLAGPLNAGDTTGTFSLVETLAGATNTPRTSGPFSSIAVANATLPETTAALASSIDFGQRNGEDGQLRRLINVNMLNMFGTGAVGSAAAGAVLIRAQIDKGMLYPISTADTQMTNSMTMMGVATASSSFNLTYFGSAHATVANRNRLLLNCRDTGNVNVATLLSAPWLDDAPRLIAIVFDGVNFRIDLIRNDGTVDTGATTALPNFRGNASQAWVIGSTRATTSAVTCWHGNLSDFAQIRGYAPTTAELIEIGKGRRPVDVIPPANVARYYSLRNPTDLAQTAGIDTATAWTVETTGTDISLQTGPALAPAYNGTIGLGMALLPMGYVAGLPFSDPNGNRPMPVTVTNIGSSPTHIQARAVVAATGAVHKPWTRITPSRLAAGQTAALSLPDVAASPWLIIETRREDNVEIRTGGRRCGVGHKIWGPDGQSQQAIFFETFTTDVTIQNNTLPGDASNVSYVISRGSSSYRVPITAGILKTRRELSAGMMQMTRRLMALFPNRVFQFVANPLSGTGRNQYYNNLVWSAATGGGANPGSGVRPDLYPLGTESYPIWGDDVTPGSGTITDLLLTAGRDISAFMIMTSTDDFFDARAAASLGSYFFGDDRSPVGIGDTGAPPRFFARPQTGLVHPIHVAVQIHDRFTTGGNRTLASIRTSNNTKRPVRAILRDWALGLSGGKSGSVSHFVPDKKMGSNSDTAHQGANDALGNQRMGYHFAMGVLKTCGLSTYNPDVFPVSATINAGRTVATVQIQLRNGGSLITGDGRTAVEEWEYSNDGGLTWIVATATIVNAAAGLVAVNGTFSGTNANTRIRYMNMGPATLPTTANSDTIWNAETALLGGLLYETRADVVGVPGVPVQPAPNVNAWVIPT